MHLMHMPVNQPGVIAFDIDGVVLNYLEGFREYLISVGEPIGCGIDEVRYWGDLRDFLPGRSQARVNELISNFALSDSFHRIPEFRGARCGIEEIRRRHPDQRLVVITSAGSSRTTIDWRRKNIASFHFDEIHVLPIGHSKRPYLAALPPGSVFVDDLMTNILAAESVGVTGILFRRSYNVTDHHDFMVSDWQDIPDMIDRIIDERYGAEMEPNYRIASPCGFPS